MVIAVIIIALVVFSVQAYFVSKIRFIGSSDPAHFANVAENFLKGNGFTLDYINEYFLKLPAISHPEEWGFSGAALIIAPFILLFGKTAFAVKLPSMIMGVILFPIVIYMMGKEMFDKKIGFLAAASMIFYPLIFKLNFGGERDTIYAFLLFLGFYLFYKGLKTRDYFYLMGVVLGFSFLVRQTTLIVFPALVLIYYLVEKKFSKEFLFGLALSGVVMAPWLVRTYLIFGNPLFTVNKYIAWIVGYFGYFEPQGFKIYWGGEINPLPYPFWVLRDALGRYVYTVRTLNSFSSQLSELLFLTLLAFVGLAFSSLREISRRIRIWMAVITSYAIVMYYALYYVIYISTTALVIFVIPYLAILLTALFLFTKGSGKNTMLVILWGAFAAFFSIYWVSDIRYFLPIIPLLFIFSWSGARELLNRLAERFPRFKREYTDKVLVIAIVIFVLISIPMTFGNFLDKNASFPYRDDELSKLKLQMADKIINVTEKGDVIMACDVGVMNFYTGRKFIELPSDSLEHMVMVMKKYKVSYVSILGCDRRFIGKDFIQVLFGKDVPPPTYKSGLYEVYLNESRTSSSEVSVDFFVSEH